MITIMFWFLYFFLGLMISGGLNFFGVSFLKRGKINKKKFQRLGGLGMIIAFVLIASFIPELVVTSQIRAILLGGIIILFFGLWDDFQNISWKKQLFFQSSLGLLLIFSGYNIDYISNPLGGLIRFDFWQIDFLKSSISILSAGFILIWLILIINTLNWSDGVDGLSGGIGILAGLSIFLVSLREEVNQPAVAILSLIFVGAVLGFWWWNFPPKKIEAGTSGSYFIGFILASLAIMAGTKIATALLILMLPVLDALWVIGERRREGKSIFQRDNHARHLHYRLRGVGLSDRMILFVYLGFLTITLSISLFFENREVKLVFLLVEIMVIILGLYKMSKIEKDEI